MIESNDFGCNEYTPQKQADFRGNLDVILPAVIGILKRHKSWACPHFVYYDITAGPGQYQFNGQTIEGSPMIFLQQARKYNLPYLADFIEKDDTNYQSLNASLGHTQNVSIWHGDHNQILPQIWDRPERKCYGLLYADPKGVKEYQNGIFDLQQIMSRMPLYRYLDIMLYVHGTAWKRARIAHDYPFLQDHLYAICKRKRIIRQPLGKQQHTFVILSNWLKYPVWEARGFYNIESERGKQILEAINLTDGELAKKNQPPLFHLTEAMPST